MSLHQGREVTVLTTNKQITLPITKYSTVFNLAMPFAFRNRIGNLTVGLSPSPNISSATYMPLTPQLLNQLLFQHSSRLHEKAAVDSFVGHSHPLLLPITYLQPYPNLSRLPIQHHFTPHHRPQCLVVAKNTYLVSQSPYPNLMICFTRSIELPPAMTRQLPAHCRHRPLQPFAISHIVEPSAIRRDIVAHRQPSLRSHRPLQQNLYPSCYFKKNRFLPSPLPQQLLISTYDSPPFQPHHTSILHSFHNLSHFPWINSIFRE